MEADLAPKLLGQDIFDVGWFDPGCFENKLSYDRFVIM